MCNKPLKVLGKLYTHNTKTNIYMNVSKQMFYAPDTLSNSCSNILVHATTVCEHELNFSDWSHEILTATFYDIVLKAAS